MYLVTFGRSVQGSGLEQFTSTQGFSFVGECPKGKASAKIKANLVFIRISILLSISIYLYCCYKIYGPTGSNLINLAICPDNFLPRKNIKPIDNGKRDKI